jgi:hypothetical protein
MTNDKTTSTTTSPNGRTVMRYEDGFLTSQELPQSTYNRPAAEIPVRPTKPEPKTAAELQAELERNQNDLQGALDHFATWQHKDEHGEAKRSLKMYLAEHEQRVKEARERLTELESADSPHTKLLKNVAQVEVQVSNLAKEVQLAAADKVALSQYDQPYNQLTRDSQKEIYRRRTILSLQHVASNAFHSFGKLELQQRTLEAANNTASKIKNAFTAIGDVITKACK